MAGRQSKAKTPHFADRRASRRCRGAHRSGSKLQGSRHLGADDRKALPCGKGARGTSAAARLRKRDGGSDAANLTRGRPLNAAYDEVGLCGGLGLTA